MVTNFKMTFSSSFLINNIMGAKGLFTPKWANKKYITHLTQPIELFILITNINTMSFKLTIVMIL